MRGSPAHGSTSEATSQALHSSLAHAVGLPHRTDRLDCNRLQPLLLLAQLLLVLDRRGHRALELIEAQQQLLEQLRLPIVRDGSGLLTQRLLVLLGEDAELA